MTTLLKDDPMLHFVDMNPPKQKYFCSFVPNTGAIISIAPSNISIPGTDVLPIDYDLAIKFLTGADRTDAWTVICDKGEFKVVAVATLASTFMSRVDSAQLVKLDEPCNEQAHSPLVAVTVNREEHTIKFEFNTRTFSTIQGEAIFFITKKDDPLVPYWSFTASFKTLSAIQETYKLSEWPREVTLSIPYEIKEFSLFMRRIIPIIKVTYVE